MEPMPTASEATADTAPSTPFDAARFSHDLNEIGLARIDLSGDPAVLALCDAVTEDVRHYAEAGYNRVQDAWRRSPAVRALAGHPAIVGALKAHWNAAPFPFQTVNFHRGSQQSPHSDLIHFTPDPVRFMCGVWIALEDVHPDAGPMIYYPGSHKEPMLSLSDAGAPPAMPPLDAYRVYYAPATIARLDAGGYAPQLAHAKKGEVLVWAANLVHGGSVVRDMSLTRRSLVTHYFFQGCDYYTLMNSPPGGRARRLPSDARTGKFVWPRGGMPGLNTIVFEAWLRLVSHVQPHYG
jgi:hypothetical protein